MLKIEKEKLDEMEQHYPGIVTQILHFEGASLPVCTRCGSEDTADVQVGVIGRTIYIAGATTKFKLIPNLPETDKYFCNACNEFFNE